MAVRARDGPVLPPAHPVEGGAGVTKPNPAKSARLRHASVFVGNSMGCGCVSRMSCGSAPQRTYTMTGKPKSLVGQALHLRLPGALLCRQWGDALCKRARANLL